MSIVGKLGEELIEQGYITTSEAMKRFEEQGLIENTLTTWIAKGHIDNVRVGKFLWVKLAEVQKRVSELPQNRARAAHLAGTRWPKAMTTDAPARALTVEDVKQAVREVLREFGLVP